MIQGPVQFQYTVPRDEVLKLRELSMKLNPQTVDEVISVRNFYELLIKLQFMSVKLDGISFLPNFIESLRAQVRANIFSTEDLPPFNYLIDLILNNSEQGLLNLYYRLARQVREMKNFRPEKGVIFIDRANNQDRENRWEIIAAEVSEVFNDLVAPSFKDIVAEIEKAAGPSLTKYEKDITGQDHVEELFRKNYRFSPDITVGVMSRVKQKKLFELADAVKGNQFSKVILHSRILKKTITATEDKYSLRFSTLDEQRVLVREYSPDEMAYNLLKDF